MAGPAPAHLPASRSSSVLRLPTYIADSFSSKDDTFSVLNAIVTYLLLVALAAIVSGYIAESWERGTSTIAANPYAMVQLPAIAVFCASFLMIGVAEASSFTAVFTCYSLAYTFLEFHEAPTIMAFQLASFPENHRPALLGLYFTLYFCVSAFVSTEIGDTDLSLKHILLLTAPLAFMSSIFFFIASLLYPRAKQQPEVATPAEVSKLIE